jgi:hypothetical protein
MDCRNAFLLSLAGVPAPIRFGAVTEGVATALQKVLRGWAASGRTIGAPVVTVERSPAGFVVERHDTGWELPQQTEVGAVCQLVVEAVDLLVHSGAGLGALHAGAVEFAGKLVLLPAQRRAGKSTLVAALAARGERIVADDLVLFDTKTAEAVATGCLPRLRLPLPATAGEELRCFVQRATVLDDGYYAYVDPGTDTHAAHGTRLPFGAIVIPQRHDRQGQTRLEPIGADEALLGLLTQDTRRDGDVGELFGFHQRLAETLPAYRLVYDGPEEAARALTEAFADGSPSWTPRSVRDDLPAPEIPLKTRSAYRATAGVELKEVGEKAFLIDAASGDIHHLDATGRAVWLLATSGHGDADVVDLLLAAFPAIGRDTIAADVAAILSEFVERRLLQRS